MDRIATRIRALALVAVTAAAGAGCDFINLTDVENPQTTVRDLARAEQPTAALLAGVRTQFARALGATVVVAEVVSDNYSIHGTGIPKTLDEPRIITPSDVNFTGSALGIYWNLQELRAFADFVLTDIVPTDTTATADQIAEIRLLRGLAFLMQAENFTAVPIEPDGEPVPAAQLLERAVADLTEALNGAPGPALETTARALLARASRLQGDAARAESFAQQALTSDPNFLFEQGFDPSSVDNPANDYLVQRALQEMQPLPRLDFLDPKYIAEDSPIPIAKAEEMHLILAEIALERGDLATATERIARAIEVANGRTVVTFDDNDQRLNDDLTVRPRDREIDVAACPACPFRSGLVLERPGLVQTPLVSATSLAADSVRGLTAESDVRHTLHLARQELLFLEGRRMSDLGIRLPMMLREIDANTVIEEGDLGTEVFVPDYIPARDDMDLFEPKSPYQDPLRGTQLATTQVTILVDMNRVLADARVSPFR